MPPLLLRLLRPHLPLLAVLGVGLGAGGCAHRNYFQPDARIGPGSSAPLPPNTDSVLVVAGRQYDQHSRLHRLFWGEHYRKVWEAPAKVQVLRLPSIVPGGLKPDKPGGGFQSISMTLEGRRDREYALRALDKEPYKTLPKVLRHTFVLNVVRDATSAAMPYAAFTVPPLAQAAGVAHSRPRLVYVRPDESGLGEMSTRFQGKMALLEEKYDALASRTPDLAKATNFIDSNEMLAQVYADPAHHIDQLAFLRARLLDVWLGDWDRHEGQWDWAVFKDPGGRVRYRAIPKDRDQVYFRFDDGLVPWLASRPFIAPKFQTFKPEYGYVRGLVKQARFIDARGLSLMSRADFQRLAADLQRRWPDTLIDRAIRRLPPAVFALEGPGIVASLKARRTALPQAAEAFYRSLMREPVVGGTAKAERFVVRRYPDSTTVHVFSAQLARLTRGDSLRFRRTYYVAETKVLTLEGLDGNDVFELETTSRRPMRVRLYGGEGRDHLRLQGNSRRLELRDASPDLTANNAPRPRTPQKRHAAYNRLNDD